MAGNAQVLAAAIVRAGGPATVVGHSYGGGIAVLLAQAHPELVRGLVLVGTIGGPGSVTRTDRLMAAPVVGALISAVGFLTFGRLLPPLRRRTSRLPRETRRWLQATLPDEAAGPVRQGRWGRTWQSFVVEQRCLVRELPTVSAALRATAVPTAVVVGEWDVVVDPRSQEAVAAATPGSEVVLVPRTGHFVPRDAPGVVADAVRRVESRAAGSVLPVASDLLAAPDSPAGPDGDPETGPGGT
jgi:pimeloyl-ACP methyl ester carboxylesterase